MGEDTRRDDALRIPIAEIADRLAIEGLKRAGRERTGPCPVCGGTDRFSINIDRNLYNCRHCGGGDGIALVRLVQGCDFRGALDWLVGDARVEVTPEERARRDKAARDREARQQQEADRYRRKAIRAARSIWEQAEPAKGSPVEDYLEARGIRTSWIRAWPHALRYTPDLPYMIADGAGGWREIHRGPAMVAAITDRSNRVTAVHRTWIDPSRPKGKALILHDGAQHDVKKVLGHKKGCAIRLGRPEGEPHVLVMGEGIETTLTASVAWNIPGASYWAGIDLGNMAGRRNLRGPGSKFAGLPDLEDREAFLPPSWARRFIYIQDGDSEPKLTRAKLLSGLRRAKALVAGVDRISIVHAGEGRDLNDLLMESADE